MAQNVAKERRPVGRGPSSLRPIQITTGVNLYAEGSALIEWGNTKILCTASVDEKLPKWLDGKNQGWITAEYSMLPRSTHTRSGRDREKVSGRTQEIQRLIGRALRSTVALEKLGSRQIIVDCDVLQADGGTRTASVTGGCVALGLAIYKLIQAQKIDPSAWIGTVSAVSLGIVGGQILTDLDYIEDSGCDVDINFVVTGKGQFVEIQGTAEKTPFNQDQMGQLIQSALSATQQIRSLQMEAFQKSGFLT